MSEKRSSNQQSSVALIAVAGLCILSLLVMTAVLLFKNPVQSAFTPPPFEPAAQQGAPDVPAGLVWGELDAGAFKASVCASLPVQENSAQVWFTSPAENTVWLKLRLLDAQGNILGETGLLHPGEYVRDVTLKTTLSPDMTVAMRLMAYEPQTYRSAGAVTVNAKIL